MKAAIAIQGETSFTHRAAVIDELERVMASYLETVLGGR
jgi:hypothetical protein